jgi:hypothetical protein
MTKLKTMFGLCVLSAFAICAFAAQGASAQTAFECASGTGAGFKDAHCKEAVSSGASFVHKEIAKNTPFGITLTNLTTGTARSTAQLKSVQSGVTLELQATEVEGTGTMENKEEGATMWAQGTGTIVFKGVTVTAPAGKSCVVKGGTVTTNKLAGTTKGLTNQLQFSPFEGTTFAEFTVENCTVAALNHVYTATGSVIGNTSGTTTNFVHSEVTTQGKLLLAGQKAGLEGSVTIKSSGGNGIALT